MHKVDVHFDVDINSSIDILTLCVSSRCVSSRCPLRAFSNMDLDVENPEGSLDFHTLRTHTHTVFIYTLL